MFAYLMTYNSLVTAACIEVIDDIKYKLQPFTYGKMFYTRRTKEYLLTFMLKILLVYLGLVIYVGLDKLRNI